MGRHKKYNAGRLKKAVEEYFRSISRHVTVTESYATGRNDEQGHMIYAERPVLNDLGKETKRLEYIIPPSVGGLCMHLGISRDTWAEYQRAEETKTVCKEAKDRLLAWNEEQLLTRSGKDTKGIIFNLQANYDYSERIDVGLHGGGVEEFLRSLDGKQEF